MDECRKQFEQWMSDNWKHPRAIEKDRNGDYKFMVSLSNWTTWKTAWASCVNQIGMPPQTTAATDRGEQ